MPQPGLPAPSPRLRGRRANLDDADRKLIDLLFADGRTSNRALAAAIGLTEVTVAARLRSLRERHILRVMAILDWVAAGYTWDGWLQISVERRSPREVADELASLGAVHIVYGTYGDCDLVVHVLAASKDDVLELLDGVIGVVPGIRRITVSTTLETVKFETHQAASPSRSGDLTFPNPVVNLDDIDRALLAALVADGRQSNREVARTLAVSESTVRVRLRRLEESNMLRITARVDPRRTGELAAGALVWIDTKGGTTRAVAARLAEYSETAIVALVAGEHDVLVGVGTESQHELVEFVVDRINRDPGVRSTSTAVIVHAPPQSRQWARHLPRAPRAGAP